VEAFDNVTYRSAVYKPLLQLPCVLRSPAVWIKVPIRLDSGMIRSLADWLHFLRGTSAEMSPKCGTERALIFNSIGNISFTIIRKDEIVSFWEALKKRFLVDSECRCFTVGFLSNNVDDINAEVLTCSERNEELHLIFNDESGYVFIRRLPSGSDFSAGLDQFDIFKFESDYEIEKLVEIGVQYFKDNNN